MGKPGTRLLDLSLPTTVVDSLAWSPDGRYLVAMGIGAFSGLGQIAIVDTRDGGAPQVVTRPEFTEGLAISPDGRLLAVGGSDHKGVLSMPTAEPVRVNPEMASAQEVVFSPDGRFVASIGSSRGFDGSPLTWVYDVNTGETQWRKGGTFDEAHQVLSLAYSPNGQYLAAIMDAEAFLLDAKNGDVLRTLESVVSSVAFTPDSRVLITGMSDGRCLMRDIEARTELPASVHDRVPVSSVAVSPDGRWVATVVEPGPAVLGTANGQLRFVARTDINECTKVGYGPDLRTIAVNQIPGDVPRPGIAVLDAATGKDVWADQSPDLAHAIAFSPNGHRIAVGGIAGDNGYLRVYDTGAEQGRIVHDSPLVRLGMARSAEPAVATVTKDETVRTFRVRTGGEPLVEAPHLGTKVTSVAISPDGLSVAIGTFDGNVQLYKALVGLKWEVDQGPSVNALAIDAAGGLVATACDRFARIHDIEKGGELAKCQHQGVVTAVAFSPDGKVLATGNNRTTTIVEVATGKPGPTVTGAGKVRALAFDPAGLLATANEDGRVQVLDPASGTVLGTVTHPRPVAAVAFSPNGALLATGGADRTVRISPMSGGVPAEGIALPLAAPVVALAFHPKDEALAVLTEAPTVSVFETETGFERFRLGHPAPVRDLAFTADGTLLVTACDDGVLRIFDGRTS